MKKIIKRIVGVIALVVLIFFLGAGLIGHFYDIYQMVGWWTLIITPLVFIAVLGSFFALIHMVSWLFNDEL